MNNKKNQLVFKVQRNFDKRIIDLSTVKISKEKQ